MEIIEVFNTLHEDIKHKLHLLDDKPEESSETTLKALWLTAAGQPVSAANAKEMTLPELTDIQLKELHHLISLRINNKPLAYITRWQRFMGIEFRVDERALIPRKETEILGHKALELSISLAEYKETIKVIDVCCGSGNLGIALACQNEKCKVYASDLSMDAVELTQENISLLKLEQRIQVKQGNVFSAFETDEYYNAFDLIVCNPPYISSLKLTQMDPEISLNEPHLAFDGGMTGLKVIQHLIHDAVKFLIPGGWLAFEVGAGQGSFVFQLCERTNSYRNIISIPDGNGVIRVISMQKPFEDQRISG